MSFARLHRLPVKTVLGAGIFSASAQSRNVRVAGIWWFWLAITLPLTLLVIVCWWHYKRVKERVARPYTAASARRRSSALKPRTFSLTGWSHSID